MEYWILGAAAVINLALAFVILTRATRASATAYFGISALFIALWAAGVLMMLFGSRSPIALMGLLLFLVSPMLTTLFMVLFSRAFSSNVVPRKKYRVAIILAITTMVFAGLSLFGFSDTSEVLKLNPGRNELNFQQGWYLVYGVYFLIMFSVSYAYLIAGVARSKGRRLSQRRLVLGGIFATSFLALLTNIILPLMGNSQLVWLGPAWTIFYVVVTCYAMVKHGLFDLRSALVLTFTYGLSLSILALMYYALAFAASSIFLRGEEASTYGFNGIDVAIALLLAFIFQPVRRFFDRITSRIFYQDSYRVNDFFALFNKTLASTNNLRVLLQRSSDLLAQTMKADTISFVIYTKADQVEQVGSGNFRKVPYKEARLLDDQFIGKSKAPVVLHLIDEDNESLRRFMLSHRLAIILPLFRQDVCEGYVFFGEHKRSAYSARDIRVIQTLADELAIAIQNALSVEELRDLNGNLEQRVNNATKELRASNAQLQRLDEVKDEFISMASHQLRTPLTSIKGYLSMLLEGDMGELTKEQQHVLREAFIGSERMVRLIGDFLNVSRLQTGKFVIEKRPVDLARLVQREVESLEANAAARGIKFVYKAPKNVPTIEVDENKLQQVIMNFSDNAIYYSPDGSKVHVYLKKVGRAVEFTVVDAGIGVPKAEQSHLFNKFYRAPNARKVRPDGTGVGLYLAKKVVDAHGGDILFESTEGKGSTFGFRLPIA